MRAFSIQEAYVKDFMQHIFTHDTFTDFEVRGMTLHGFTYFEISGEKMSSTKEYNSSVDYCTWGELCPYVRYVIKGRERPRAMKIIFAKVKPEAIHPNAASLFFNMMYESDKIICTTATSQKNFDMSKAVDIKWDDWVADFLKQKGIIVN